MSVHMSGSRIGCRDTCREYESRAEIASEALRSERFNKAGNLACCGFGGLQVGNDSVHFGALDNGKV